MIQCRLPEGAAKSSPFLRRHTWLEPTAGDYHYRLWLPAGYLKDTSRRWPCLFVASAGGNARLGKMEEWVRRRGFVAVMLVESKNGPWGPIVGNFLAGHDDAVQRVRIQEGLKFATGMSGGARASSVFVQSRPGFAGLILQGAGAAQADDGSYLVDELKAGPGLPVAMTMGRNDRNRSEAEALKALLGSRRFRVFEFDGGHTWAPAEVFEQAAEWVWQQAVESAGALPALKDMHAAELRRKIEAARADGDPWARYQLVREALEFAQRRELSNDPACAADLRALGAELSRLRADPAVAKQATAAEALVRLRQSRVPPTMLKMQLQSFVQQHAGTDAAEEAQRWLAELGTAAPSAPAPRGRR